MYWETLARHRYIGCVLKYLAICFGVNKLVVYDRIIFSLGHCRQIIRTRHLKDPA